MREAKARKGLYSHMWMDGQVENISGQGKNGDQLETCQSNMIG